MIPSDSQNCQEYLKLALINHRVQVYFSLISYRAQNYGSLAANTTKKGLLVTKYGHWSPVDDSPLLLLLVNKREDLFNTYNESNP